MTFGMRMKCSFDIKQTWWNDWFFFCFFFWLFSIKEKVYQIDEILEILQTFTFAFHRIEIIMIPTQNIEI